MKKNCLFCGRLLEIKPGGRFRRHVNRGVVCEGSWRTLKNQYQVMDSRDADNRIITHTPFPAGPAGTHRSDEDRNET